jgi:hypothetical protein
MLAQLTLSLTSPKNLTNQPLLVLLPWQSVGLATKSNRLPVFGSAKT